MFMGDSGSMLIGLVFACGAITLAGRFPPGDVTEGLFNSRAGVQPVLLPLLLPVAMLLVPFVDLLLAVVRRTRAGRSPFSPDKLHLHHRLLEIGHSHRAHGAVDVRGRGAGLVRRGGGQPVRWVAFGAGCRAAGGGHRGGGLLAAAMAPSGDLTGAGLAASATLCYFSQAPTHRRADGSR